MLFIHIIRATLCFAVLAAPVHAADRFALSSNCPDTGLYQDHKGQCRPKVPYSKINAPYNGLWKFPQKEIILSPQKIDLGRLLFFDPILAHDEKTSCASCHDPKKSFSGNKPGLRSVPGLVNLAYSPKFFWDGRTESVSDQLQAPLLSPLEMKNPTLESILARLNANRTYKILFRSLRSDHREKLISWPEVAQAMASFQSSLISFTAPYDRYALGDSDALNESQIRGFQLFRSFMTRCSECHTPPLFTNHEILTVGAPGEARSFKVPTLRQVALTKPYMHRGAFAELTDVIRFYNDGGGRSKDGLSKEDTHWHVRPIGLSESEQRDLVDFLAALTDHSWKIEIPKFVPSGLPIEETLR